MICNVIGYCVEMVFCYLKHGYWESRQSLIYGPFGLAYGLGGVLLSYLLFKDTKKAWWKVFIKSYIWGTVAEYICSLGEELVFGHVSWDYSKMPLNINGRVCALYSVFWGIMGLVWVKLIYPLFMKLIHKIPLKIGKVLFWIMFILILIDIILSCEKDGMALLADVVSWYLLVGGLILFALASPAFIKVVQLGFVLPAAVGAAGKWLAIAGALLVLLFAGREAKNPLMRLVKGLYALYGSTSWLGDLLSYSRLLALGLATGVIGQVVNQMASMGGDTPLGIVLFIVVFLVGHALNIAINLLGAYVHTNRLQFVEFFGKFYEGGGQPFEPLAAHTKYYQISEVK